MDTSLTSSARVCFKDSLREKLLVRDRVFHRVNPLSFESRENDVLFVCIAIEVFFSFILVNGTRDSRWAKLTRSRLTGTISRARRGKRSSGNFSSLDESFEIK